jgi:hypothetical protein|tara:strand:- start:47 stop:226 length:180 start_codon:yes stop_codon:yes gene_type:complete
MIAKLLMIILDQTVRFRFGETEGENLPSVEGENWVMVILWAFVAALAFWYFFKWIKKKK